LKASFTWKKDNNENMKIRKKLMKNLHILIIMNIIMIMIAGCSYNNETVQINGEENSVSIIGGKDGPTSIFIAGKIGDDEKVEEYTSITMDEAKQIFENKGNYIILDVRRPDEFSEGHIPEAINVANEDITDSTPAELPDKDQVIYVYCRSGRRSTEAASKLSKMGYTNIVEFGGIIDWPGEIEK